MDLPARTDSSFKRLRMGTVPSSFQIRRMVPQMIATMTICTLVKRTKIRVVEGINNAGVLENLLHYLG